MPEVRGHHELHENFLGETGWKPGQAQFRTHGQVFPGRGVGPDAQEGSLSLRIHDGRAETL